MPFDRFARLFASAKNNPNIKHPNAMVLSTNCPKFKTRSRMMDMRYFDSQGFVFCTHLDSPKSESMLSSTDAALLFWWDAISVQVRIEGSVLRISEEEEQKCFDMLPRLGQIYTHVIKQGDLLEDEIKLRKQLQNAKNSFNDSKIPKPDTWIGFRLEPKRFEFLELKEDRLHLRQEYKLLDNQWAHSLLQP